MVVRLSCVVQVALWVINVVDGVLLVWDWGHIVLVVVSVVQELVVGMVGLVADSVLVQVWGWSVVILGVWVWVVLPSLVVSSSEVVVINVVVLILT